MQTKSSSFPTKNLLSQGLLCPPLSERTSGKLGVNFEFYFHLTSHISTIFKCCPFYLLSAPQFHFYKTFCHHSGPGHHLLYGQPLWPSLPASTFDLGTPKYAQICHAQAHISKCPLDNASWRYTSACHFQASSWGTCVLDWVPDLMSHTLVKHAVILSNSPSPPSHFCLGNFLHIFCSHVTAFIQVANVSWQE